MGVEIVREDIGVAGGIFWKLVYDIEVAVCFYKSPWGCSSGS